MPRETCTAPATLPLFSTSGASRTSTTSASPLPIMSRACAALIRGTAALAASSISLTDVAMAVSSYIALVFAARRDGNALIPLHPPRIRPIDEAAVAARQRADLAHLGVAQGEIEDRGVLRQPLELAGARNDGDVLLHQEAQADLRRALAVRLGGAGEHRIVADVAARQRAVGDDRHAVLARAGDQF